MKKRLWRHNFCPWRYQHILITWFKLYYRCRHVPKFDQRPQLYMDLTRKTVFFDGWSWFKFDNLRLVLGTNLKSYTSVAKLLKLKARKFWHLIPTFVEVTGENHWGAFLLHILNRVKLETGIFKLFFLLVLLDHCQ